MAKKSKQSRSRNHDRSTNAGLIVVALIVAGLIAYLLGPILVFLAGGHK